MSALRSGMAAIADLVLPQWCPGCGRGGQGVCDQCMHEFRHWFRADVDAPHLVDESTPVWAAAGYHGVAAAVIMAWKSGQRPDLAAPMARLGFELGRRFCAQWEWEGRGPDLFVVPAPSGWRRRWRGHEIVAPWATAVAAGIRASGAFSARMRPVLTRSGGGQHQLSSSGRRRDRDRSIRVRRHIPPGTYVLVDDVITTGATFSACAAALTAAGAGIDVLGGIGVAATPTPRGRFDQ